MLEFIKVIFSYKQNWIQQRAVLELEPAEQHIGLA